MRTNTDYTVIRKVKNRRLRYYLNSKGKTLRYEVISNLKKEKPYEKSKVFTP